MSEIKRNIKMSEDGERTDFIAQITIEYNGEKCSAKVDLGAKCEEDGTIRKKSFDLLMEYLRLAAQGKLLTLNS